MKTLFELLVVCSKTHKPISIIELNEQDFVNIFPLYWSDHQNNVARQKLFTRYPKLKGKVYIQSRCNTSGALYGIQL